MATETVSLRCRKAQMAITHPFTPTGALLRLYSFEFVYTHPHHQTGGLILPRPHYKLSRDPGCRDRDSVQISAYTRNACMCARLAGKKLRATTGEERERKPRGHRNAERHRLRACTF